MASRTATFFTLVAVAFFAATASACPLHTTGISARNTEKVSYTNCGSPTDIVQIRTLTVSPSSGFTSGANVTVTTVGVVTQTIQQGSSVAVTGQLDGSTFFMDTKDLCADVEASMGLACPIQPNTYTHVRQVELPIIPVGDLFTVTSKGTTSDGGDLFCLEFTIDLTS